MSEHNEARHGQGAEGGNRQRPTASWGKPLPYPIVIADRRNNRLIEIAPDKRIVWEFPSPDLGFYRGNEDVNFSADGKQLAMSEEDNYDPHRGLREESRHLNLRRAGHARQRRQLLQLSGRRAPARGRQVPDGRHPQLPRPHRRSGDKQN